MDSSHLIYKKFISNFFMLPTSFSFAGFSKRAKCKVSFARFFPLVALEEEFVPWVGIVIYLSLS